MRRHNCGYCHTCGTALQWTMDGEEWCPKCEVYRRYRSHGWTALYEAVADMPILEVCPDKKEYHNANPN
jgi:uncharacterized Zn finger protein (UPF0148 family)